MQKQRKGERNRFLSRSETSIDGGKADLFWIEVWRGEGGGATFWQKRKSTNTHRTKCKRDRNKRDKELSWIINLVCILFLLF